MVLPARFVIQRDAVESEYTKANDELNKNREKLKACDEQISALIKEQALRKQELTDCLLNQKRIDDEVCCWLTHSLFLYTYIESDGYRNASTERNMSPKRVA